MKGSMSWAEWQVMRVLWARPAIGSSQIIHYLEGDYDWKPSTVKTLLNRLKEKGLISVSGAGKRFVYQALSTEEEELAKMGQDWLANQCETKHGQHLQLLLEKASLTVSDLEALIDWARAKKAVAPDQVACSCPSGQCTCYLAEGV